jgi:hypothetical protein
VLAGEADREARLLTERPRRAMGGYQSGSASREEPDEGSAFVHAMASDGPVVGWLRPGDRLVLACFYGAETTLSRGDLVRLPGADAPLDLIGLRVRCARCGRPPCDGWFDWRRDEDEGG